MPSMMRAADWIEEQRKLTEVFDGREKAPEYGLLPAGRLEDPPNWGHWFGANAEAVAGMTRLAQALADIKAPEAAHYAEEAAAYRQDLRDAVLRASSLAAVVRLRDGTYVPYVPTRPYLRIRHFGPIRPEYYSRYQKKASINFTFTPDVELLAGPVLLLLRDVFGANEPLANWILDDWEDNATMSSFPGLDVHGSVDDTYWFGRGGILFDASLNLSGVYLRRHEIPAALRSLYNSFVAIYYPELNIFAEEFHEWGHAGASAYKTAGEARAVLDFRATLVREDGDTLWLASGVPRRWLAPGKKIELRDAPTYFGPVSYRIEASESGVEARVDLPTRNKIGTTWLVVRAPEGKTIRTVEVDGKPRFDFDAAGQRIRLPSAEHPIQISVHY
jgi:hypothetical protein